MRIYDVKMSNTKSTDLEVGNTNTFNSAFYSSSAIATCVARFAGHTRDFVHSANNKVGNTNTFDTIFDTRSTFSSCVARYPRDYVTKYLVGNTDTFASIFNSRSAIASESARDTWVSIGLDELEFTRSV